MLSHHFLNSRKAVHKAKNLDLIWCAIKYQSLTSNYSCLRLLVQSTPLRGRTRCKKCVYISILNSGGEDAVLRLWLALRSLKESKGEKQSSSTLLKFTSKRSKRSSCSYSVNHYPHPNLTKESFNANSIKLLVIIFIKMYEGVSNLPEFVTCLLPLKFRHLLLVRSPCPSIAFLGAPASIGRTGIKLAFQSTNSSVSSTPTSQAFTWRKPNGPDPFVKSETLQQDTCLSMWSQTSFPIEEKILHAFQVASTGKVPSNLQALEKLRVGRVTVYPRTTSGFAQVCTLSLCASVFYSCYHW